MIHQLSYKLREQIRQFSGDLCRGHGKVITRFIEEMLLGMLGSGSVLISKIARVLNESIRLKKTHDRLCRNLADAKVENVISSSILKMGAKRVYNDTLLIIDPSDITKKYARKMEHMARVHDGSAGGVGNGYWLCELVAAEIGESAITPLAQRLYSQKAPDFKSENEQILEVIDDVLEACDYRGILVFDRGGDRRKLLKPWTKDDRIDYLVRQRGDRHLLYKGKMKAVNDLAEICKTHYAETIVRIKAGEERIHSLSFGYLPVNLPEARNRPLWLVVVRGFGKKPLILLTTKPMRRNRKVLKWAIDAYLTRWRIEETIRFIKQSWELENVRVRRYIRLKNTATLLLATAYFTAVVIGIQARLRILALHVLDSAKRLFGIPDFPFYALADGMKSILSRTGQGILHPRGQSPPENPQLDIFDIMML